jgi:outer membrane protein assembly factor BamA
MLFVPYFVHMVRTLLVFVFVAFFHALQGQSDTLCWIGEISVEGARRTRESVIMREVQLRVGDTLALSALPGLVEESRLLLLSTGLFTNVSIYYKSWEAVSSRVHVVIAVEEAWYLFPLPVFELADRNFNVWWVEQNRALDRVNYGLDFSHLNVSGNRDPLKLKVQFGYTRKYNIRYTLPYINRKKTLGLGFNVDFSENKELNYATVFNKQAFWRLEDRIVHDRFRTDFSLSYRPGARRYHFAELSYMNNRLDPFVADSLNVDFFLDGRRQQRYFALTYEFAADFRNIRAFATDGYYLKFRLRKDGLGVFGDRDALTLTTRLERFLPLHKRWNLALISDGKYSLIRRPQPYNDNRALGFNKVYLPGYEYYIADGLDLALVRSVLRYKLIDHEASFGRWVPLPAYRRVPMAFYLALNSGWAIAHDPFQGAFHNPLNNRPLWGGGLGLHCVFFYDKVLMIEYSINHLKEKGLFLHLNMNI